MQYYGSRNTTSGSRSASPARTVRTVRELLRIRTYSTPKTPNTHIACTPVCVGGCVGVYVRVYVYGPYIEAVGNDGGKLRAVGNRKAHRQHRHATDGARAACAIF
eukprot:352057-Chlamydomonas_euryale.AAC.6